MTSSNGSMNGKVCLITGSTSGIGRVTARELARMGATVVLVARDRGRGEATQAEISAAGSQTVDLLVADLASQADIRRLAGEFLAKYDRLHVLVNNAGAVNTQRTVTVDGFETTFAVNHLAYFLLTNLLLDVLRASAPARIVNVASTVHATGTIDFDNLQAAKRYGGFRVYSQSKLANVLFTYELARRLEGTDITVNCLHPGAIASGFGLNNGWLMNAVMKVLKPFMRTPEQGAETSIYLAVSPQVAGVTGKYFANQRPVPSSRESYDRAIAQRLWEVSAQLTNLPADIPDKATHRG